MPGQSGRIWSPTTDSGVATKSVRRFAYKLRGAQIPQVRAVILTAPGEEGHVDYGSGPMVREPHSGKYRRIRLFVLTLGYSRKAVRLLVFRSSTRMGCYDKKLSGALSPCPRPIPYILPQDSLSSVAKRFASFRSRTALSARCA
jgi:hypothetical protein